MQHSSSEPLAQAKQVARDYPDSLITLINPAGILQYVGSAAVVKRLGYTQKEIIGHPFADFVDPLDVNHLGLAIQDALLNDQSVEVGVHVNTKSGDQVLMRGYAWTVRDPATGDVYLISRGERLSLD
jgi:PAS domain S-box-containing protein